MRLDELAAKIGGTIEGDGAIDVRSVAALEDAQAGQISFLSNPKYTDQVESTKASAVIVAQKFRGKGVTLLRTANPYYAFQQAVTLLHGVRKHPHEGIHPKAHVEPTATIGANTVVYPGAYVGARVTIGRDCIIYPNVVIYDETTIGDRVIVHGGAVIGVDGFGYAPQGGVNHKIPQVGRVVIEDDVEVGPNSAIERGALQETRIGKGTKLDCLVVVGHGSTLGEHCLIVAQTGISGSVTMGHHVTMGGQCGVAGHITIGNEVMIGGQSGVMADVADKSMLLGAPAMPVLHARRVYMLFTKLPELVDRIRELESQVESLKKPQKDVEHEK